MIHRYRGGTVPKAPAGRAGPPLSLDRAARDAVQAYQRAMDENRLDEAAAHWIELATRANGHIQQTRPWELAKAQNDAELDRVLTELAATVARLAVLGQPFVPATAAAIWALFPDAPPLETIRLDAEGGGLDELTVSGQRIAKPPILFPKPKPAPA
ncbi:MAG TPA: hypothetical protein VH137_02775 [Gemmatimonadales bacterium]|nr:hypothetical protein [Gemmatimonadales bacterium]